VAVGLGVFLDRTANPLAQAFSMQAVDKESRTRSLALRRAAANVGLAVGTDVGGLLLALHGDARFVVAILLDAASYIAALCIVLNYRIEGSGGLRAPRTGTAAPQVPRLTLRLLLAAFASLMLSDIVVSFALPAVVARSTGVPHWVASVGIGCNLVIVITLQARVAKLFERRAVGGAACLLAGAGLSALAYCLFGLADSVHSLTHLWLMLSAVLVVSLAEVVVSYAQWRIPSDLAGDGDVTDPVVRRAGYWWEISMRQVDVSRTIVFDAPRRARGFFETLIADNLDIGRPANVEIIFGRKIRRDTQGVFRTAIDRPVIGPDTGGVVVNVFYKHSRIKQYLKDGRAMRIETVINAPRDLGCNARLHNLDELQAKPRACNHRILEAERAGQGTVLARPAFERIARPSVDPPGRTTRTSRRTRQRREPCAPGTTSIPYQPAPQQSERRNSRRWIEAKYQGAGESPRWLAKQADNGRTRQHGAYAAADEPAKTPQTKVGAEAGHKALQRDRRHPRTSPTMLDAHQEKRRHGCHSCRQSQEPRIDCEGPNPMRRGTSARDDRSCVDHQGHDAADRDESPQNSLDR
jgi:hypothetical protein